MTEKPFVSVIINCYNGEKYVRETLDSVFAQNYKNYELIFWDNCSTDSTPSIVKSYNDERLIYIKSDVKTTLGKARNLAMEKVHGDYISFIDADDIWLPDFLSICVEKIINNPLTAIVYTRFINFEGTKEWLSPGGDKDRQIGIKELISSYGIGMSGTMFSKAIMEKNSIRIDERFSLIEDYDFFIRLGACGEVYYISTPQMRYRWNASGLTQNSNWADECLLLYQKAKEDDRLIKSQCEIRKIYEIARVRDLLNTGNRLSALRMICSSARRNPPILRYLFPVVFGMNSFHKLRMLVSKA